MLKSERAFAVRAAFAAAVLRPAAGLQEPHEAVEGVLLVATRMA